MQLSIVEIGQKVLFAPDRLSGKEKKKILMNFPDTINRFQRLNEELAEGDTYEPDVVRHLVSWVIHGDESFKVAGQKFVNKTARFFAGPAEKKSLREERDNLVAAIEKFLSATEGLPSRARSILEKEMKEICNG